jgi:chemosensory pili system protein ChpA (sensor histidine kinase/response regulator)
VHQVYGALSIVGLDGVTQVVESIEALLAALDEGGLPADESRLAALRQSLSGVRQYLDDLMAGEVNQPLRLLGAYQNLATARGLPRIHTSDLFYPDLSLRPPKRSVPPVQLASGDVKGVLKSERMRYQKGLLTWLKNPANAESGRRLMQEALFDIESHQETQAARAFWRIALAFVEALAEPGIGDDTSARQLCSRIDAQIRRLLEGSGSVAERVMREALYYVAKAPASRAPIIAEVQNTFDLASLLPPVVAAGPLPQDAALRKLRESLMSAEEFWGKYCTGSVGALSGFADQARNAAELTNEIGQTDLKRLGQGLGAVANWLVEDAARFNDTVAMEVATAILLLQNAQESFRRLGTDFAQQVDLMVARLYACIAGRPAADNGDVPLLDEMTRKAQEKLLIGQVGREIQNNLAQIEQALDVFFRDPTKSHDLAQLNNPLKQVGGALAMLGHFSAIACLNECGESIKQFAQPDYQPVAEDFETVADKLSLIGFFVDALQHGEVDFDGFVAGIRGEPKSDSAMEADEDEDVLMPSVEVQLAQQARDTHALVEALREAPEDVRLQDEIKLNLQSIQKDADLVANIELGETAKAALEALQSGDMAGAAVGAALFGLKPQAAEAPQPSAETLQLAESSHEEIDAELLAIFLEEAHEVLGTLAEQTALLSADPHDTEALTTIRRSTHTLKGSGRMVGLIDLGEAAWELEQTINLWLRQDQVVTPEMIGMVEQEHALFSEWVTHLERGDGLAPNPAALVALANRLRGVESLAEPAPAPAPEPEPEPEPEALEVEDVVQVVELPMPELGDESPSIELDLPALEDQVVEPQDEPVVTPPATEADLQLAATAVALEDLLVTDEDWSLDEEQGLSDEPSESEASLEIVVADNPDVNVVVEPIPAAPTLYDIFLEEAQGHLRTLVDGYADLDANPSAPTSFDITRAAHTLGGIAATVGLMPLNRLAIALEHALLRRDGSDRPDSIEGLETVRQAIVTLEGMFAGLADQIPPLDQPSLIVALEDIFHASSTMESVEDFEAEAPIEIADLVEPDFVPEKAASVVHQSLPLLTDELDEQLLPIFLEEAADQLRDIASELRSWRIDPASPAPAQVISRILHTFKGNARMAGAMNLGEVTHQMESRLEDGVRSGADVALIDEIEAGYDLLAQSVEYLRDGPPPAPVVDATASDAPQGDVEAKLAESQLDSDSETAEQRATLRVRADLIDRLANEAGELSIARARIEGEMRSLKGSLLDLTENVIRLRRQLREIEIQAETQMQARVAHTPEGDAEFDPLELDRFTRFHELTRFMAESVNDVATVQQNLLKNLDDANAAILAQSRLNRSLQQDLMSVRMVPFASQPERLYRIVRQTAKEVGKRANLDILGGQVEIDRSVLDKMLGPIEHMLRNSVTHGIESREERLAAGKSEVGEISMALTQEGNEIILSIADDGKGLDAERIRARAETMGLLQPGQQADEASLFDFIFQPGFSTATELTQLAGRGIGMDVVKTEVLELGGRIEILSVPGKGTTFRLYLPLTLAVTKTLLTRVGTRLYAVPSTMIEQVQELKENALAVLRERGEAVWQGARYPFHYLPHLLGDASAVPEERRRYWVLLLRSGSQRVAVQVDELNGNQEVVVKNIGTQLARVVGISGATVLGDGQVVLILNPVALASRTAVVSVKTAAPVAKAVVSVPTVMVVDDSLTVRKITSRLLTREGYQVVLAKDGVDALEQLQEFLPDVVLSDIEMPRMDGFDLVRNMRADPRLKPLPVIMITSRTADKHRNYAFEIGANHYLGKPYDEDELIGLISGYVSAKVNA